MGETVAHMGIVKAEQDPEGDSVGRVYLIHASGKKGKGGVVEKVPLGEYVKRMSFIGVRVTRFE